MSKTASNNQSYSEDNLPEFTPMQQSLAEIRAGIPAHLFVRDTPRAILYLIRDIIMAAAMWKGATYIDPFFKSAQAAEQLTPLGAEAARWASWAF
jgi:hypothetical protein